MQRPSGSLVVASSLHAMAPRSDRSRRSFAIGSESVTENAEFTTWFSPRDQSGAAAGGSHGSTRSVQRAPKRRRPARESGLSSPILIAQMRRDIFFFLLPSRRTTCRHGDLPQISAGVLSKPIWQWGTLLPSEPKLSAHAREGVALENST